MRDERDDARQREVTMRNDDSEIATGDKTVLQSPASWWGFLFRPSVVLSEHTYVG